MTPYILTFIGAALCPLFLAGYGGHLATLALPPGSTQKRNAILLVWAVAIVGVSIFGVLQVLTYRADREREARDQGFRTSTTEKLTLIENQPDVAKKKEQAAALKASITAEPKQKPKAAASPSRVSPVPPVKPTPANPLSSPIMTVIPEAITSDKKDFPTEFKVTFQVTENVQPFNLTVQFDAPIDRVNQFDICTLQEGSVIAESVGFSADNKTFIYGITSPPVRPRAPLLCYFYGKAPFNLVKATLTR